MAGALATPLLQVTDIFDDNPRSPLVLPPVAAVGRTAFPAEDFAGQQVGFDGFAVGKFLAVFRLPLLRQAGTVPSLVIHSLRSL